jgi:hypothetical protein
VAQDEWERRTIEVGANFVLPVDPPTWWLSQDENEAYAQIRAEGWQWAGYSTEAEQATALIFLSRPKPAGK